MKNHNCTSTPAPAACQPDNVRGSELTDDRPLEVPRWIIYYALSGLTRMVQVAQRRKYADESIWTHADEADMQKTEKACDDLLDIWFGLKSRNVCAACGRSSAGQSTPPSVPDGGV